MKTRTDAKRREIIAVATELFIQLGYERTSMSLVSQRLGGSKATLYGYFRSKEELLLAVLEADVEEKSKEILSHFEGASLEERIRAIGLHYLQERTAYAPPRLIRLLAALPEDSAIGETFYREGMVAAWRRLQALIEGLIARGELRPGDSWTMTMHLKGLLDQDFMERKIMAPKSEVSADEIEKAAAAAAAVFMRAYGPECAGADAPLEPR